MKMSPNESDFFSGSFPTFFARPGHCPGAARRRKSCSKWKQLQVESVDIKRLPDGSSRGFAFVKFADKELQG